jgi:hypothetical protein
MAALTDTDIKELESRGITIGATVTCAVKAKSEIQIKSWDDWEVEEDACISSINPIDDCTYCWLYLAKNNTYATVVNPEPSYEVDWTHAPSWANYHVFTYRGKGYWAERVRATDNGWDIYRNYHSSGFVIDLKTSSINTKKSMTARPETQNYYLVNGINVLGRRAIVTYLGEEIIVTFNSTNNKCKILNIDLSATDQLIVGQIKISEIETLINDFLAGPTVKYV